MEDENDLLELSKKSIADNNNKSLLDLSRKYLPKTDMAYDNQFLEASKNNVIFQPKRYSDDYLDSGDNYRDIEGLKRAQSERQPWLTKFASGFGRATAKAASEIVKMPMVLGGIAAGAYGQLEDVLTGNDKTDFMQTAFNNAWIRGVNDINEDINTELLPVYVRKSVENGNLWSNLTSIDFWATEGADGLGYILSMLAPGAAIGKLGLGSKLAGSTSKYASMNTKVANAMKSLGKTGKVSPKKIDLYSQTMANTLFEAGAEAQGAMDSFEKDLEAKLQNGEITEEEYNQGKKRSGEIGRNIFLANAAILVGPNAAMSKMIWGGPRNKVVNAASTKEGKLATKAPRSLKTKINQGGQEFVKAGSREGFFEEGMQSTVESYFTDDPDRNSDNVFSDFGGLIGELVPSYLDMLQSTDGQKAIALGAMFGGGMQSIMSNKQKGQEEKKYNDLVNYANDNLDKFYSTFTNNAFETDPETGDIIYETNEQGEKTPKLDPNKLFDKMDSLNMLESVSAEYDKAIARGDKETVDVIRHQASSQLILPFIMDEELGLDVLRQHLENSSELEGMTDVEKSNKEQVISGIMEQAVQMKQDFEVFQEFAPSVLKFDNKKATIEDKKFFMDKLNNVYVGNKQAQHFFNSKIENNRDRFNKILDEKIQQKGLDRSIVDNNDKLYADLISKDSRLKALNEQYQDLTSKLDSKQKENEGFWNNNKVQKEYDSFVKDREKEREDFKKKEEVDNTIKTIKNVKTKEDLNEIDSNTGTSADPMIKEAIKAKRKEFQAKEDAKKEKDTNDQLKESEKNSQDEEVEERTKEDLTNLLDSFGLNENIEIPIDLVNKYIPGVNDDIDGDYKYHTAIKTGETDSHYHVMMLRADKQVKIPKIKVKDVVPSNVENNFSTEGSVNHDANVPASDENDNIQEDTEVKNGTIMLSTYKYDNPKKGIKAGDKIFDDISDAYLEYEKTPINKKGKKVTFKVNTGNNSNQTQMDDIERRRMISLRGVTQTSLNFDAGRGYVGRYNVKGSEIIDSNGKPSSMFKQTEVIREETREEVEQEINAKYDAELDELENNNQSQEGNFDNEDWNEAIEIYNKLLKGNKLKDHQIQHLIDHLPLNGVVSEGVETPIMTKPKTNPEAFEESTRILRTHIVNALSDGIKLEDISTTIDGQYPGLLKTQPNKDGKYAENNVLDLHHFSILKDSQKKKYLKENLAMVNDKGEFVFLNNENIPFFNKKGIAMSKAKGDIYLMVPQSNGQKFPLKLNIRKINDIEADLLADLYEIRITDEAVKKNTTIEELENTELLDKIKKYFSEELKLIGKSKSDLTVKDLTDYLIYDNSKSVKSRVKFGGIGVKGLNNVFIYGNEEIDGAKVIKPEDFNKDEFKKWLTSNKRRHIKFKPHHNETSKANMMNNDNYLMNLINNKIISTNAVVNEPTFQGYSNIYLKSNILVNSNDSVKKVNNVSQVADKLISSKNVKPYSIKEDGDNLYSAVINGKNYWASFKTNKVYEHNGNTPKKGQNILPVQQTVGEVVVDNAIIEKVELDIRSDDFLGDPNIILNRYSSNKVENNTQNVRNSQNNFVSSHEVNNTADKEAVTKLKDEVKVKDKIEASRENIKALMTELRDKKLLKVKSGLYKNIMKGSNQERFDKLSKIAEDNNLNVKEIITKC